MGGLKQRGCDINTPYTSHVEYTCLENDSKKMYYMFTADDV